MRDPLLQRVPSPPFRAEHPRVFAVVFAATTPPREMLPVSVALTPPPGPRRTPCSCPLPGSTRPSRREQLAFRSAFASWRRTPRAEAGRPDFFCAPPIAREALLHVPQSQLDLAHQDGRQLSSSEVCAPHCHMALPFAWPGRSSSALSRRLPYPSPPAAPGN